jgi:hypothetical protein
MQLTLVGAQLLLPELGRLGIRTVAVQRLRSLRGRRLSFLLLSLSQAHAGPPAVLFDEIDAGRLERLS